MTDTERILEKVRRLLALSTSSNVHEAELAAAKAQELLLKYNLEMAETSTRWLSSCSQTKLSSGQ